MTLRINPEFKSLCPPLSSEEFERLEQNILADGRVLDTIVTWRDQIIDGHNRYEIATKHNLKFSTSCRTFKDNQEAKNWIINHQLGRRNLSPQAAAYLRGQLYHASKQPKNSGKSGCQNDTHSENGKTAAKVAAATGVSASTINRDAKYAEAVDSLATPIKHAIQSGELKASQAEVQQLAKYDKKSQKQIVDAVKSGDAGSIKEAIDSDDEPEADRWESLAAIHKHACDDINRIIREVRAITEDPYGEYVAVSFTRIESSLKDAKTALWQLMPMGEKQGSVVTRMDQQRSKK